MARISQSSAGRSNVTVAGTVDIQDTNGDPITATAGALNVNVVSTVPSSSQTTVSAYSEVDSVAIGATVTILTYTVPAGVSLYLNRVLVSSDCIAQIDLEFDGILNARKRLSYTLFNETFDYLLSGAISGYKAVTGTVITVIGTNMSPGNIASFNATLQGVQQ